MLLIGRGSPSALGMDDRDAMTRLEVPVQLRRCGMAVRLIVRAGAPRPGQPDPKLIRILARGHDWLARLLSGRSDSIPEIARDEELTTSYVVRTIYTAFLAPDLAQRIARGEQPAGLDAKRLLNSVPLPLSWSDQRRVLGFTD